MQGQRARVQGPQLRDPAPAQVAIGTRPAPAPPASDNASERKTKRIRRPNHGRGGGISLPGDTIFTRLTAGQLVT